MRLGATFGLLLCIAGCGGSDGDNGVPSSPSGGLASRIEGSYLVEFGPSAACGGSIPVATVGVVATTSGTGAAASVRLTLPGGVTTVDFDLTVVDSNRLIGTGFNDGVPAGVGYVGWNGVVDVMVRGLGRPELVGSLNGEAAFSTDADVFDDDRRRECAAADHQVRAQPI